MTALILASASLVRARLLTAAGVAFDIRPGRVDEDAVKAALLGEQRDGRAIADALAELKAVRGSLSHGGVLVLGADQVLVHEGRIVSKSADMDAAAALLRQLRGGPHELFSAAVLARDGAPLWRHVARARLTMRAFSDAFLEDYLKAEGTEILQSVGCYHLEGCGAQLFETIEGDYFSILGLPLLALLPALREQGVIGR